MYTFSFEKLNVWHNSRILTVNIYKLTNAFPKDELYSLTSQIKRSASSIATNIAEGTSRMTPKDKARFLTVSFSSAMETLNHLILSRDLCYISEADYIRCRAQIEKICNQIISLRKHLLES